MDRRAIESWMPTASAHAFVRFMLLIACLLCAKSISNAAEITVTFDHASQASETASDFLDLTNGEKFKVVITNTNTDEFDYIVAGIEISSPSSESIKVTAPANKTKELTLQHDRKFGGYWVRATHKSGIKPSNGLTDKAWLIPVRTAGWNTDISGGFTVSKLTNPVFEARSAGATTTVARNKSAEDAVALGLAGFIHVYHEKLPQLAASFGLGVTNQSETSYFLGPSWRWGDKGALTAGYCWGSVDRLPSGIREGDIVSDPNALASMNSQVKGAAFFALSFKFITVGDLFQKPFAGSSVKESSK